MGEIAHGAMLIGALACAACTPGGMASRARPRRRGIGSDARRDGRHGIHASRPRARLGVDTRRGRDRTRRSRARDPGSSPRGSRACRPTMPSANCTAHSPSSWAGGCSWVPPGSPTPPRHPGEHARSRLGERIRRRRRSGRTRRPGRLARGATPAPRAPQGPACGRSGESRRSCSSRWRCRRRS